MLVSFVFVSSRGERVTVGSHDVVVLSVDHVAALLDCLNQLLLTWLRVGLKRTLHWNLLLLE
jgi:hypothetical protein